MASADFAVGVVGLGFGAVHARVLNEMDGVTLAAICDRDAGRLAAVARGKPARTYDDYQRMLREERLDALVVAVPARLHEEVALAAIDAGIPVLIEKPLAPSFAEGLRLVEKAERAGVPLMPGHIERFNPAVGALRRHLDEAGRVLQVGTRRLGPFNARTRDVGVIHDLAYHDVDVMRHLLGREIESVQAETSNQVRTAFDDGVVALLRFGGAGAPAGHLEANWLTPRKVRDLWLLGDRGLFVADYADTFAPTLEFYPAPEGEGASLAGGTWSAFAGMRREGATVRIPLEAREPLEQELSAFIEAVRTGRPPPVSADDALAALAVVDALAEAGRTGGPVAPREVPGRGR